MGQHGFLRSECSDLEETRVNTGFWLSLVEHSLGVRGVGSSNLPVPTKNFSCAITLDQPSELACVNLVHDREARRRLKAPTGTQEGAVEQRSWKCNHQTFRVQSYSWC